MENGSSVRPTSAIFQRWGIQASQIGYTAVPNYLAYANLFLTEDLKLNPTEFWILVVLLSCWRDDRLPQPSKRFIADRIGLSPRQVQRSLRSLEAKGFVHCNPYHDRSFKANEYNLEGVIRFVKYVWSAREIIKSKGKSSIPRISHMPSDVPVLSEKLIIDDSDDDIPF